MPKHPNGQNSVILSGRSAATARGGKYLRGPGDFLLFPPGVDHEFVIDEDTVTLDIFAPRSAATTGWRPPKRRRPTPNDPPRHLEVEY